jgi:hypothetical protein
MPNRSASESALVDFILKTIRAKTSNELMDIHDKMNISLKEMLDKGLTAKQLNSLPVPFLRTCVLRNEVSLTDLENGGLESNLLTEVGGVPPPPPGSGNGSYTPPPPNVSEKEKIIKSIIKGDALIPDIQFALSQNILSESDLAGMGYNYDVIERLKRYNPVEAVFPKLNQLPPLRKDASDIFFLGMPGSGKSTMLASFFSFCNRIGVMANVVDNAFGNKYRNQLVLGMADGHLPSSTPTEFINFIPVDIRLDSSSTKFQKMNFIDMAGEKFKSVANTGLDEFKAYKEYLNNKNRKCLIFIIDYFKNNKIETLRQDQNLQEVMALLEKFGVFSNTDAVYLIVTKADMFPDNDKQSFADNYIYDYYINFLNACKVAKKKYNFELVSFPYSIGATCFNYILQDCEPTTNTNLEIYPKQFLDRLREDLAYNKSGLW